MKTRLLLCFSALLFGSVTFLKAQWSVGCAVQQGLGIAIGNGTVIFENRGSGISVDSSLSESSSTFNTGISTSLFCERSMNTDWSLRVEFGVQPQTEFTCAGKNRIDSELVEKPGGGEMVLERHSNYYLRSTMSSMSTSLLSSHILVDSLSLCAGFGLRFLREFTHASHLDVSFANPRSNTFATINTIKRLSTFALIGVSYPFHVTSSICVALFLRAQYDLNSISIQNATSQPGSDRAVGILLSSSYSVFTAGSGIAFKVAL